MELTKHLKSALWTEAEVGAALVGAVGATMMLDAKKIFANDYAINPQWFTGNRMGAPFKIKYFGAIKAGGAVMASTYIQNPWLKLVLMGIALQGTLEQARVLAFDQNTSTSKLPMIGDSGQQQLDAELKKLAEGYRKGTNGPEYVGDAGNRYESQVAGSEEMGDAGNRYESQVAGVYDEDHNMGFSFSAQDATSAF